MSTPSSIGRTVDTVAGVVAIYTVTAAVMLGALLMAETLDADLLKTLFSLPGSQGPDQVGVQVFALVCLYMTPRGFVTIWLKHRAKPVQP